MKQICQSCGMPITNKNQFGKEKNGELNNDFCKYCYDNGEFIDNVDMNQYIEMCSQYGSQANMTNSEMKEYCTKLFPTLKRWKQSVSNNFFNTIFKRRTIRSYNGEDLTNEELDLILKSANASPVGMGQYENVHLTIIKNKDLLAKIDKAGAKMFGKPDMHPLYNVPTLVVISSKNLGEAMANVSHSNCAIIAHNMALTATELGIGSVYIWGATMALSKDEELVQELNLPKDFFPCCALGLGKTNEKYEEREIPKNRISQNIIK